MHDIKAITCSIYSHRESHNACLSDGTVYVYLLYYIYDAVSHENDIFTRIEAKYSRTMYSVR